MKIYQLLVLLIAIPSFSVAEDLNIDVNLIPPDANFSFFGVISANLDASFKNNKKHILSELEPVINEIKAAAIQENLNKITIFSKHGDNPVNVNLPGVNGELSIFNKDQEIFVLFFKENNLSNNNRFIPFVNELPKAEIVGNNYKIELKVNTADISKAKWVYLNLPKFQKDALQSNAKAIYIESTKDQDYEEVYLPMLNEPIRISNEKPLINVLIYR